MKQKNILLIAIDDGFAFWRYRTAFGARLRTPNLDRIMEKSTTFTSAYCQVPICGPSRASAMSGLSPFETGVLDNYTSIFDVLRPEQMWQYRLKRDGYYCSTAGKVHHGFKPLADEFHDVLYSHPSRRVHFGPAKDSPQVSFGGITGGYGTTDPAADKHYYDFRSSKNAIAFLKGYDADTPFYREVGFHHPHLPFRTPARFKEMYDIDEFIQPEDWAQGFDLSEFTARYMMSNMDADDTDFWRKSVRNYFSAYSHVDHHIGRVWNALQASRHAGNTVMVFFSDHGYHMGDKGRFRKFTLWEEAARVPLIIYDPDAEGQQIDAPVGLVDIGPTILDYTGSPPLSAAVGKSLKPLIRGESDETRAVPTFWYGSASQRYGRYRTILYQDGSTEFYDVDEDMWLGSNLGEEHPEYDAHREKLVQTCFEYGVDLVGPAETPARGANFQSLIKGAMADGEPPTLGMVSIGEVKPAANRPGYRVHFATLEENGTIEIPHGVSELRFASDTNGGVSHLKIIGNSGDNNIIFASSHDRFLAEIHPGPGHNRVVASHDTLKVHCGPGGTHVLAGLGNDTLIGGAGIDRLECRAGDNTVYGGTGDATIIAGRGNDTIYSGAGQNTIICGPSQNRIILDGGSNRIEAQECEADIAFMRTGLPQFVDSFDAGKLDLSDWLVFGSPKLTKKGKQLVLSCGAERAFFTGSSREAIEASLP